MTRTNEELDNLIKEQETHIPQSAEMADTTRGHISRSEGQILKNRIEAINALESRKEMTTVNLKAGI